MLGKFFAYFITSSNAILTDAAESIVNVLASSFAFYSVYLAQKPKDLNHPYGHGKVAFFSMFVEGVLIILAGMVIIAKAVYNLFYPHNLQSLLGGTIIIATTGFINWGLGAYMVIHGKKERSDILFAEGKHLQTDAYSSMGLVIGLTLIHLTHLDYLDTVLSVLLGGYIIFSGYQLFRKSVGGLMDESDFAQVEQVVDLLNEHRHDAWIDVHNLRTQRYGQELHIDCHLTLPYYFDLNQVHDEISTIDHLINQNGDSKTELFIHADPCLPQCCHYCRMSNCAVRSEEKYMDIAWTMENLIKNQKHFNHAL